MEYQRTHNIHVGPLKKFKIYGNQIIQQFLCQQTKPDPYILFVFIALKYLELIPISFNNHGIELVILLLITITTIKNHYFFYIALLKFSNQILSSIVFIIGVSNLNQLNKIYLFMLIVSFSTESFQPVYALMLRLCISIFICLKIYTDFIFNTLHQNRLYFIGFSLTIVAQTLKYISKELSFEYDKQFIITVLILTYLLSQSLINNQIIRIEEQQIQNLKKGRLIYFKIESFQNKSQLCFIFLREHKLKCQELQCFCHEFNLNKKESYEAEIQIKVKIINYLYMKALTTIAFSPLSKTFLLEKYSKFLLQNKQAAKAILTIKYIPHLQNNYLINVHRYRIWRAIKQHLKQYNYFLTMRKKYEQVFFYDLKFDYVKQQITEIIEKKIMFWKEVGKNQIQLKNLESNGLSIIDKMESLHRVFQLQVLPVQAQIINFRCTLMYSSYLLLTTNYSEYVEQLVKNAQNTISQINLKKTAQVSGIQLMIAQTLRKNGTVHNYCIIINLSNNLAEVLGKPKKYYIHQEVDSVIPDYFADIHNLRFDLWTKSSLFNSKGSQIVNQYIELPLKKNSEEVLLTGFEFRTFVHNYTNQIRLQAILFRNENQGSNIFINLSNKIIYTEGNFQTQILEIKQIKDVLHQMQQKYRKNQITQRKDLYIEIDENSYHFTFTFLFDKACKCFNKEAIIRVKYENQNLKEQKLFIQKLNFQTNKNRVQGRAQNLIQVSSQSSIQSRKDVVQMIISIINQKISAKHQFIFRIFVILLIIVFGGIMLAVKNYPTLHDNLQVFQSYVSNHKTINYMLLAYNLENDINLYDNGNSSYVRIIDKISQSPDQGYLQKTHKRIKNISKVLQQQLLSKIMYHKDFINEWQNQQYNQTFPIQIKNLNLDYNISLQQSLIKMITQLKYLEKYNHNETLMNRIFVKQILPRSTQIKENLDQFIDKQYEKMIRDNTFIASGCIVLSFLLLVPLLRLLISIKFQQKKVYSLFCDIQPKFLIKQLKKLKNATIYTANKKQTTPLQRKKTYYKTLKKINESVVQKFLIFAQNLTASRNHNSQAQKMRTRPAEINCKDSTLDPKKISLKDIVLLSLFVLMVGWILLILINKIDSLQQLKQQKQQFHSHLQQIHTDCLLILATKLYIDENQSNNQDALKIFDGNLRQWLENSLREQYQNQQGSTQIEHYTEIQTKECFQQEQVICNQKHSYILLRGIIKKAVFDNINMKQKLQNPQITVEYIKRQQIRGQLFIAQEASSKNFEISNQILQDMYQQISEIQQKLQKTLNTLTTLFFIIIAPFFIVAILYLRQMEIKYQKSILLLTFLSREMAFKNKRVQSFVSRLTRKNR